jgi:hypothetical protein
MTGPWGQAARSGGTRHDLRAVNDHDINAVLVGQPNRIRACARADVEIAARRNRGQHLSQPCLVGGINGSVSKLKFRS